MIMYTEHATHQPQPVGSLPLAPKMFSIALVRICHIYIEPIMYFCRLTNRGLYPLALEICDYLKVSPVEGEVKILRQWAMRKVCGA